MVKQSAVEKYARYTDQICIETFLVLMFDLIVDSFLVAAAVGVYARFFFYFFFQSFLV
jgi:hypothetical protein